MSSHPKTILVTAGCGFIGTWVLRELLAQGHRAVVLDAGTKPPRWDRVLGRASDSIVLVQGSLLDRPLLKRLFEEHPISNVIHLAALLTPACQTDPWAGCQVNVMGTVALLEQIRDCGARIQGLSYASSVAVFGDEPDSAESQGAGGHLPMTFYGAFKRSVELIAEQYWRHFQIRSLGLRPQVAYGPERDVGLTAGPSLAARAVALGESYTIRYTGRVGYDYVEDVARAFVRGALETPPGARVADLEGEMAEVDTVVTCLHRIAGESPSRISIDGTPIPAHAPPHPNPISALYPDWINTSLEEGLRKTVAFYRTSGPGGSA